MSTSRNVVVVAGESQRNPVSDAVRKSRDLGVGIGLHRVHYPDFLAGQQQVDWLEVHTENYLGDGGYDLHVLEQVRQDYPLSFHGTGLSIGSAGPLDTDHLDRVTSLVNRFQPALISEHLSWATTLTRHLYEPLPLPFTSESLDVVTWHIDQMQNALKRTVLIENVARRVSFRQDEMTEIDFFCELVRRTGCAILIDVNNLHLNQCNHGEDAFEVLEQLPQYAVAEIHLGVDLAKNPSVADHRSVSVSTDVWQLYGYAVERFGIVPTLVECDADVPPIGVLLDEAVTASKVAEAFTFRKER